jgi:membrane-associated protease RseP (regulator of RpoE activity)
VGIGRIGGELAAYEGTAVSPFEHDEKLSALLSLLASLNFMLFAFNLLPLLPLDGGHVAAALWEGARRQIARLRHRPDPGPVDTLKLLPLTYGVAAVLLGMSALLIYADVVKPISLTG